MNIKDIEEYKNISSTLKTLLKLEYSPVAVKLFLSEDEAKEVLEKTSEKSRHCEMVRQAALGKSFYATDEEELCKGGAAALGLREFPPAVASGKKYYSLGRFASEGSAKHQLDQVTKIDTIIKAVGYAPLEEAKFNADIIVLFCKPVQAMVVSQATGYTLGKRFNASFAGIQSLCSDVVAKPFMTKEPNMSVGCSGSRKFASIPDEELIIGLTAEDIKSFADSLELIS